jgi:hypothetical protein
LATTALLLSNLRILFVVTLTRWIGLTPRSPHSVSVFPTYPRLAPTLADSPQKPQKWPFMRDSGGFRTGCPVGVVKTTFADLDAAVFVRPAAMWTA